MLYIVNNIELTIKRRCINNITTTPIRTEDVKPEPTKLFEQEEAKSKSSGVSEPVGKEEESSGVPCPAKKKKIDDVGNVVLAAHVASLSSPPDKADATGKHKSQHLETRNDYAISPENWFESD